MFSGVPPRSCFAASQLRGTFGLPRPGGKLSAGWFFLLGSAGLLGAEVLSGNVSTLLRFSR